MASFLLFLDKSAGDDSVSTLNDLPNTPDGAYSWLFIGKRIRIAVKSSRSDSLKNSGKSAFNADSFYAYDKSGTYIVSDSRVDYKRELAGKLGISRSVAEGFSDSKLILFAYLKWGEECLSHLYGNFSFVIWNPQRDEVFCARDHFGCRPLYYIDQQGYLALASEISAFKILPGFTYEIKEQYILDSLCSIVTMDSRSAYKGIRRLKPAHQLKFMRGQSSGQQRYWDLHIREDYQRLTLEEASLGLKNRFIEAVWQRSHSSGPIGVELSGGLDSSGIASALTMLPDKNVKINAFTHSASSDSAAPHIFQKTEMEYSKALIEKYGSIIHIEITDENSAGAFKSLSEALMRLYKPMNLHYAMNSNILFGEACNLGTAIMYSGFGGDEGVSYQGNGYFNELIRKGQHAKLKRDIKSIVNRHGGGFIKRLIKIYINYFLPRVTGLFRKDWRRDTYNTFAIHKGLARKYRMKRKFFNATSFPVKPDVRAMQYFRLMYPSIPERIEETYLLAQQHGIEYRYPFLDVKLIEYFYSLPSEYKYRDGMGRYLYREAMKEILPEKIRRRTDKSGNTIPYVFAWVLKDEEIFRKTIHEGRQNNACHYVNYDKLDDMLDILKDPAKFKEKDFDLRAFQSAISVLVLQQWQREGKIDIGIKC